MERPFSNNLIASMTKSLVCIARLLSLALLVSAPALAQVPTYVFANGFGSTASDGENGIATDASGNVYITGQFFGTIDFDPSAATANLVCQGPDIGGDRDMYVASYDASGNYRWAFRVGSTGQTYGADIALDGGGNVVVAGRYANTADFNPGPLTNNLTGAGSFVAKYSPTGNYLWAISIVMNPNSGAFSLALDASGNIALVGSFNGTVDFNPGSSRFNLTSTKNSSKQSTADIFVARYTASGAFISAFKVGSTGHEGARAVAVDGSGNLIVTGDLLGTADFNPGTGTNSLTTAGGSDAFVAKYTSAGAYVWAFRLGSTFTADEGHAVAVASNDDVIVTGRFNGSVDFDHGANVAALQSAMNTDGNGDFYVARYSASGTYQWAFNPAIGTAVDVAVDANDDIYVTGSFKLANDFDPGPGTEALATGYNGFGGFVAKYTSSSGYLWAFSLTSTNVGNAVGRGIAPIANGDIILAGVYGSTTDFDPSAATADLACAGSSDIFVAKYNESSMMLRPNSSGASQRDRGPLYIPELIKSRTTFR